MIFLLLLFLQHLSASWAIVNNEIYCDESLEKREKKRLDDDRSPREGEARSNREIFKSKQLNPSPAPKLAIATREETFDGGALFLGVLFFSNVDFRKMGKKKNNSMMMERAKKKRHTIDNYLVKPCVKIIDFWRTQWTHKDPVLVPRTEKKIFKVIVTLVKSSSSSMMMIFPVHIWPHLLSCRGTPRPY